MRAAAFDGCFVCCCRREEIAARREAEAEAKEAVRLREAEQKREYAMAMREKGIEVPKARIQISKKALKARDEAKNKQGKRMRRYLSAPSKKDEKLAKAQGLI